MVFFFTASSGNTLYMGKDKFENEDLIKYGLPEDIWFHVEDLSSAHVYLRLEKGQKLEDVPQKVLMEACQLVKANSIVGCKQHSCGINYTRWRNLHKTSDMEPGAIGFHDRTKVKKIRIEKDRAIVNALNKTKREDYPDLAALQEARAREFQLEKKKERQAQLAAEKELKKERERAKELQSYSSIFASAEGMTSNADVASSETVEAAVEYEDDFM